MVSARWKEAVRLLLPRRVRPYRIFGGPLKGMPLVTSLHDYPAAILGRTEAPLLHWIEENVTLGEVWLDVGAHYGYTTLALARFVGTKGAVFAFEPVLMTAAHLMETKSMNMLDNVIVIPLALTDDPALTASVSPIVRGMADHDRSGAQEDTIYGVALDALTPILFPDRHVDGIKIDVQGMEIQTLRGMARLLAKDRPRLVVELHAGVDRTELLRHLQSLGYSTNSRALGDLSGPPDPRLAADSSYVFVPSSQAVV